MEDIIDLFIEDHAADKDEQFNSLCAMSTALEVLDFESQIKFLDTLAQHDDSVRQIIGFDDNQYLANLKQQIDMAEEGFWQDLLRWGPFGAIIGQYLQSFGRIRKCCNAAIADGISQEKVLGFFARSLYLPDAKKFEAACKGLQSLYDGLVAASKNLDKFEPSSLYDKLKGTGITVTESDVKGVKKFDFKAITGDFLGKLFVGVFPAGTIGAHVASDNGGRLSDRGWNAGNLLSACKVMLKLVEQGESLKSIQNKIVANTAEAKKEYGQKLQFLNKAAKVYLEDVKELGRGLSSGIYHVKN